MQNPVSDQRQDHVHRTRGSHGEGSRGISKDSNWRARQGRMWNIKQRVNPAELEKRPARRQVISIMTSF